MSRLVVPEAMQTPVSMRRPPPPPAPLDPEVVRGLAGRLAAVVTAARAVLDEDAKNDHWVRAGRNLLAWAEEDFAAAVRRRNLPGAESVVRWAEEWGPTVADRLADCRKSR